MTQLYKNVVVSGGSDLYMVIIADSGSPDVPYNRMYTIAGESDNDLTKEQMEAAVRAFGESIATIQNHSVVSIVRSTVSETTL